MTQAPKTFKELFANTGIEPKTDESGNTHYNFKATKKQETLEEVAERLYPTIFVSIFTQRDKVDKNKERRKIWIEGAEYMQKQMYREEEVENIIYELFEDYASNYTNKALEEFENFKKK